MADNSEAYAARVSMPSLWVARFFAWLEARSRFGLPVLAFLIGALLSRAFAPTNFFPIIFIAVPLALLLLGHARDGFQAFGHGWWVGFGLFSLGLNWIGFSFTQQDNVPEFMAPIAVFILTALLSVYIGTVFWATWRLRVSGFARVLVFASAWTLFEIARGFWFTGFPWHLIGAVWAEWLPVAQSVYWISVYGLSFVTLLAAGSLVLFFETKPSLPTMAVAALGVLTFPVIAFLGYQRLASNDTHYHLGVSMRLVQANVQQDEKWRSYLINDHFDNHMQLSRSQSENGKADGIKLLIWPETAVQRETFDRDGSLLRWRMSRLLNFGSYAITGAPRFAEEGGELKYYNSLIAFNSKGSLYARYDKNHLVPFGEYLPFEKALKAIGLSQLTELAGGSAWAAGQGLQTVKLPGVPSFSPLICYEAIFPGQVVLGEDRPEWMLVISNDAWFGMTDGPYQHLALSRLRAIEEGLPMVRSTSTGVSAVIDSYGRTISSLGLGRRGTVESPLPKAIEAPRWPVGLRILLLIALTAGILLYYLVPVMRKDYKQPKASD